jgi:hypothetical protein
MSAMEPATWQQYIDDLVRTDELTTLERSQTKQALQYLERLLGVDFFTRIESQYGSWMKHPLAGLLVNYAPWTRRRLVRIVEFMRAVQASPNFERLAAKLSNVETFHHDLLVIEVAARLTLEGMVATFEPTLPIATGQKQPDIRLEAAQTGETFCVEVAVQRSARASQRAFDAMNAVIGQFMYVSRETIWAGRLLKTPASPHLLEIADKAATALKRSETEKRFIELYEEGTVEIAFCPESEKELLTAWCEQRGLKPGEFQGPPYDENDVERLKRKIAKEQRQLPKDRANALFIADYRIFFSVRDVRELINQIEEEVFEHQHVPIVIVHAASLSGAAPEVIQKGEHRYARRSIDGLSTEDNLVLVNRYSPKLMSTQALAAFLRAF